MLDGIFHNGLQHEVEHSVIKLAFLNVVLGIKAIVMGQLLDAHIRLDVFQLRAHSSQGLSIVQAGTVEFRQQSRYLADVIVAGTQRLPLDVGKAVVQEMRVDHSLQGAQFTGFLFDLHRIDLMDHIVQPVRHLPHAVCHHADFIGIRGGKFLIQMPFCHIFCVFL